MKPINNTISTSSIAYPKESDCAKRLNAWQQWATQALPGAGECRDIALVRLEACKTDGSTELDLSDLRLTSLPPHLPDLLETLDISKNSLTRLPEALPTGLKKLRVGFNQLSHLPATLPDGLEVLNIENNRLSCLPEVLPDSLKLLNIDRNNLTSLPVHLPVSLNAIYACHNQLTRLPEQLPPLLNILYANYNQLVNLPENLPEGLFSLNVSDNHLMHLPVTLPRALQELDVYGNDLVDLPAQLPVSLKKLDTGCNQLTCLPAVLPASLKMLHVNENLLTVFPACLPANLIGLDVSYNRLTSLPTLSSIFLEKLDVSHNLLSSLPENLPALLELYANDNQLTCLPMTIPDSLNTLYIANNLLPALPNNFPPALLSTDINIPDDWCGNVSHFLISLKRWHNRINVAQWTAIHSEDHAYDFMHFLNKLNKAKNHQNNDLRNRLANWLTYLAQDSHQELRRQTFLLASEAAQSCVDRASFYFNHMYILTIEHQLLAREVPLEQVVKAIQGMFRLQVLERIAAEKVAVRQQMDTDFVEDLEIYLAYQYKLRELLSLPIYTALQFEVIAGITDEDINQAMVRVTASETADFGRYWLTESALWAAKLEKWDAEKKATADGQYLEAILSPEFNETVNKALQEKGIPVDDIDAQRNLSKTMAADLFYQHRYQLTQQFLLAQKALSLLDQLIPPSLPQDRC